MKQNVTFDCDGVILNFLPHLKKYFKDTCDDEFVIHNSHKLISANGTSRGKVAQVIHDAIANFDYIPACDGINELFELLYKATGEAIYIVTARNQKHADITHRQISKITDVPFIVAYSGDDSKLDYMFERQIIVEDRRKTAIEFAEAGLTTFLVNTYYNQADFNGLSHKIIRTESIKDLIPIYKLLLK